MYEILRVNNNEINIKGKVPLPNDDTTINWNMTKGDGSSITRKPINTIPGLLASNERVYLYESNIDPMLRFLHIKNIKPCGWIKITKTPETYSLKTTSKYEYCVNWNDIVTIDKPPTVPINTLAFDIECTSSHGDFPRAIKNYNKLSKDLLELKDYKLSNIIEVLNKIPSNKYINNYDTVNRLYLKKNDWIGNEQISNISKKIKQYLWLRDKARYIRKNNNITINIDELVEHLYITKDELLDEDFMYDLCDIIPTLTIKKKKRIL